jgi:hypothetical protein
VIDYVIDLDEREWIGVPPSFPYLEWADAAAWASAVATAAVLDDPERRARLELAARNVAEVHPEGVDHVLWYAPHDGRTMGVAFLSVADAAGDTVDLEALAATGLESATPPQVVRHPSDVFGIVVQSATTIRLSDLGDDRGAAAGVVGSIRTVAVADDTVFMLNAVDEDLSTLALMQEPMRELFERIEVLPDTAAVERAVRRLADEA